MTTLLQMVNRVRKEGRHSVVSAIDTAGDELTSVLVDLVNQAKRDVLEGNDWDFDKRTDGILKVAQKREYETFIAVNGSASVFANGETDYQSYSDGSAVSKLVVTSDTTYGDEAFRITNAGSSAGSDQYTIELAWPGTGGVTLSGFVYADEYVLPSTVKDVLSVRHEDADVTLRFVDRETEVDRKIPTRHRNDSEIPDLVTVGGTLTPTARDGGAVTSGLGMLIHPVPTTEYILRYTYRYRHPELVSSTDTLENVPTRIVDEIVGVAKELAYANHVFNDPTLARYHRERNEDSQRRARMTDNPQPMARIRFGTHVTGPHGNIGSPVPNPRVFYKP